MPHQSHIIKVFINKIAEMLIPNQMSELVSPDRKHLWLVAAPKTGSTWLNAILIKVLDWPYNALTLGGERREQEIFFNAMVPYLTNNLFSQHQHCRLSQVTADFITKFRVKVILQGRNLLDSLVSFRDYTAKGNLINPFNYITEPFLELSPERQLDLVIDTVTPWYLNFYASWFDNTVDYYWVSYEALLADTFTTVENILAYSGIERSKQQIQNAIDYTTTIYTRFNVGKTGRGESVLTASQKERVYNLVKYYEPYPGLYEKNIVKKQKAVNEGLQKLLFE